MKIGILTSSYAGNGLFGCNYGAILQGYALIKQLRLLGHEAYDINYLSDNVYLPKQYNIQKRIIKRIPLLFNIQNIKNKYLQYKNIKNQASLEEKFKKFINEFDITYTGGQFYTYKQLMDISERFDAFIVGSDVVWNPLLYQGVNDRGHFLSFALKGVKRIAYAPSFGVTDIPDKKLD